MYGVESVCCGEDRMNGEGGVGPGPIKVGPFEFAGPVTKLFCNSEEPRGLRSCCCGRFPALSPARGNGSCSH